MLPYPVQVEGLSKKYRTGKSFVQALDDVSFSVPPGEFVAIMGASGSGKSTLLHLMAGLTEPTSGTVKIEGIELSTMNDAARTRFRLEKIGVVFQAFNLIPTLTAEENILLPSMIQGNKSVAKNRVEELLETLEIKDRRHHRPDALSGGEQQRVAIGRALLMDPALILADEPTGNLDSKNSRRLCELLRNLCDTQKRTIVLVTHEKSVANWGDRCITLQDGKIRANLSVEEDNGR